MTAEGLVYVVDNVRCDRTRGFSCDRRGCRNGESRREKWVDAEAVGVCPCSRLPAGEAGRSGGAPANICVVIVTVIIAGKSGPAGWLINCNEAVCHNIIFDLIGRTRCAAGIDPDTASRACGDSNNRIIVNTSIACACYSNITTIRFVGAADDQIAANEGTAHVGLDKDLTGAMATRISMNVVAANLEICVRAPGDAPTVDAVYVVLVRNLEPVRTHGDVVRSDLDIVEAVTGISYRANNGGGTAAHGVVADGLVADRSTTGETVHAYVGVIYRASRNR